jgi:ubiquinone biosynthesis protein UbiJ
MIRHNVGDNKYTIVFYDDGSIKAFRHGEHWRDLTGDGMVLAMLQEIDDLKEQVSHLNSLVNILKTREDYNGE